jgi:hypothetical protein
MTTVRSRADTVSAALHCFPHVTNSDASVAAFRGKHEQGLFLPTNRPVME